MKKYIVPLFLGVQILLSCSSDKDNEVNLDSNSLVGTWNFTELNIDDADSAQIKLSNDVIKVLVAQDCQILTFNFQEDKSVSATSKDFTETGRDIRPDGSGLLIECPSNTKTESSVWNLDGDQLTFVDENQSQKTVTIALDGNTLIIPAEIVNEDNLKGTKAIFKRQ